MADAQYAYNDASDEEMDGMDESESGAYAAPSYIAQKELRVEAEDDDDDDDDDDEEEEAVVAASPVVVKPNVEPRGKPQAMSASIMAHLAQADGEDDDDSVVVDAEEEDDDVAPTVVAVPVVAAPAVSPQIVIPPKKPPPKKKAASPRKKPASKPGAKPAAKKKKPPPKPREDSPEVDNFMDKDAEPITPDEYEALAQLMVQFCRVPLLAEFSRPVKLLHPELAANYSKIISHPVDLGLVCRGIRRRAYKTTRDVRLDMWRVFANCVKFHSHPSNKEKVPSFVSIALHLREYFNCLWQEYMLPSELPRHPSKALQQAMAKRAEERVKRLENSGVLMMSKKFLTRVARLLGNFMDEGGRIDVLDKESLFGDRFSQDREVMEVSRNVRELQQELLDMAGRDEEYSIDDFSRKLNACFTKDGVLEDNQALRNRIRNRLDRLVGKLTVPLHEANSRGVTQSSIWGNIATTIWARESGKKAYWPALCLGILPPNEQREGWHAAVTERNEARLPPKLRTQLMGAKKKCEAAQKRQSLSYFLVEFLGTHEFIWVRETDIVEKFDPAEDPNKAAAAKGKKRASRSAISSVTGSKTYAMALEECEWATDEFEQVLQEAFDYESEKENTDDSGDEEEGEFTNYSYSILNQSDDEAEAQDAHAYGYNEKTMSIDDWEEANYLLANEGKADTSADARKQAKKRAQALKKKKVAEKEKKEAALLMQKKEKKKRLDAKMKEKEALKEEKELERRRKKRTREREKALNAKKTSNKKKRLSAEPVTEEEHERGLGYENKRARASAIVKAFLARMAQKEEYQGLHLGGSSAIPAATVESSALLSMALAFRVCAGELPETNEAARGEVGNGRPWELIDTDGPKSHQERSENLQKKVKLLEAEIEQIRANTQRRKELLFLAVTKRQQEDAQIQADDQMARRNHFKKKKKPPASSSSKGATKKIISSPLPVLPSVSSASTPQRTPSMASTNSIAHQSESGSDAPSAPLLDDDDATDDDEEMSDVAAASSQG